MESIIKPLNIPLPLPENGKTWKPIYIFRYETPVIKYLSCHISTLLSGHSPHLPHHHVEEEILVVLQGEVALKLPDAENGIVPHNIRLKTGDFTYYPQGFHHTLESVGEEAANYLMFRWTGLPQSSDQSLEFSYFSDIMDSFFSENSPTPGIKVYMEGPTLYLKKLHVHRTVLMPGMGYKPHTDPYDIAIIVLEGEVETLNRKVFKNNLIYYPAGQLHGMRNPGSDPACYLVFEFHNE